MLSWYRDVPKERVSTSSRRSARPAIPRQKFHRKPLSSRGSSERCGLFRTSCLLPTVTSFEGKREKFVVIDSGALDKLGCFRQRFHRSYPTHSVQHIRDQGPRAGQPSWPRHLSYWTDCKHNADRAMVPAVNHRMNDRPRGNCGLSFREKWRPSRIAQVAPRSGGQGRLVVRMGHVRGA